VKIFLVRHTSVDIDTSICYGWSNVDVSENFLKEAKRVKKILTDNKFVCYSSDLKRCRKLAKFISDEVILDKNLREINFGKWEGKSWNEIEKLIPEKKIMDFVNLKPPDGESFKEQNIRVLESWEKIISSDADTIVVVAHGGTIRIILCKLLGMPLENAFKLKIDYASISSVAINNNFITVDKINY